MLRKKLQKISKREINGADSAKVEIQCVRGERTTEGNKRHER